MRKDPRKTLLRKQWAVEYEGIVYKTGVPEKLHPRRKESYEIGQEHAPAARPPGRWSVRRRDPVM